MVETVVDESKSRVNAPSCSGRAVHESAPLPRTQFLLYETEDRRTRVECRFVDDSLWLSQLLMAELFQVSVPTVNEHLKTLFADGEILLEATFRKFRIVRAGRWAGQKHHVRLMRVDKNATVLPNEPHRLSCAKTLASSTCASRGM